MRAFTLKEKVFFLSATDSQACGYTPHSPYPRPRRVTRERKHRQLPCPQWRVTSTRANEIHGFGRRRRVGTGREEDRSFERHKSDGLEPGGGLHAGGLEFHKQGLQLQAGLPETLVAARHEDRAKIFDANDVAVRKVGRKCTLPNDDRYCLVWCE